MGKGEVVDHHKHQIFKTEPCGTVVENEPLSRQLEKRNPWRTLARYHPRHNETTPAGPFFPIYRLPHELLHMVAKRLSPESAACFALSSKRMYIVLGSQYWKMPTKNSLWKLLLMLEPERQASFACGVCLKLHRPTFGRFDDRFACTSIKCTVTSYSMPDSITPSLVRLIGRKYLEDPRSCQEYLTWAFMTRRMTTEYIKVAKQVAPRMVDGNLLVKTETYIHPFHKGQLTHRSLLELVNRAQEWTCFSSDLDAICAHHTWERKVTITKQLGEYLMKAKAATNCETSRCLGGLGTRGYHRPECYDDRVIPDNLKRRTIPQELVCLLKHDLSCDKAHSPGGKVSRCKTCPTNFDISACDVPDVERCVVFTTWKDFGGVRPGQTDKWDLFTTNPWGSGIGLRRNQSLSGWQRTWMPEAYLRFEGIKVLDDNDLDGIGSDCVPCYEPKPDRMMIRDLSSLTE